MSLLDSDAYSKCCSSDGSYNDKNQIKEILLTGATGFIGIFLLEELLEKTNSNIYCLIREGNGQSAEERLIESMKNYYLWKDCYASRIKVLLGDLSKPYLGLSEAEYLALSKNIEIIYHTGASVNFIYSYEALEATNVGGTEEILKLAVLNKLKSVHYISSMNVFSLRDIENCTNIFEDTLPSLDSDTSDQKDSMPKEWKRLGLGYLQTKRVSEHRINIARSQGVPVNIYRVGRVSGHSKTGACQKNDFFWRMVKASLPVGKWPDMDAQVDFIPVDYTCKAILHISLNTNITGRNFHLFNKEPFPYGQVIDCIRRQGYDVVLCTYEEWLNSMVRKNGKITQRTPGQMNSVVPQIGDVFASVYYDDSNLSEALKGSGVECPPVDQKLLDIYFNYFKRIGFF